jgi:hypothetical protein
MGSWVLVFVQISGFLSPVVSVQPIYFHTKEACDAMALEFNNGQRQPKRGDPEKRSFGAICFATGA